MACVSPGQSGRDASGAERAPGADRRRSSGGDQLQRLVARQTDAAGRLGVVAVVACLVDMMLQPSWMFADLFIAPSIESLSPGLLDGSTPSRLGIGAMLAWLANASFVLLAVATFRARVLPRTCAVALAVTGAITPDTAAVRRAGL